MADDIIQTSNSTAFNKTPAIPGNISMDNVSTDNVSMDYASTDDNSAEEAAGGTGREKEIGGRDGPDPTRYGDWEKSGRCIDF